MDGRLVFLPKLSLKGLRLYQGRYREVHNHCEVVAQVASINLISTNKIWRTMAKSSGDRIFVIDIQERQVDKKFGEDKSVGRPGEVESSNLVGF